MILRRLGNKSKIAMDIQKYFPPHKIYIEPFFGAGGMFFNKPKVSYNFLNDIDGDVINCFDVLVRQKDELKYYLEMMPYDQRFWDRAKEGKPVNNVEKAVYFLFLSNCGYMGKPDTLHFVTRKSKSFLLNQLEATYRYIVECGCSFTNSDFRRMLKQLVFVDNIHTSLIYADPPYLNGTNNYSHSFTEADSLDLFNCLHETGCKYAMSEFDHPFILEQAKQRGLNVVYIGERQNLKNRRTEILVMNYNQVPTLFQ